VECLVALTLVLVITGTVASILAPAEAGFQAQAETADLQQRLRVALDVIERDLIVAGAGTYSGPRAGSLAYFLPPILPYRVGAVAPDPPGTVRADAVSILHVPFTAAQTRTMTEVAALSTACSVSALPGCPVADEACGFREGMTAVIYDGYGAWDLFTVGSVGGATLVRQSGVFANTYAAGAHVTEIRAATYYLQDDASAGGAVLRRYDGDRSDLPVVDHLVRFEVEYLGDPQPPRLRDPSDDPYEARTTYGPGAAPGGVASSYPPGESCTFRLQDGALVPRLAVLAEGPALVRLPPALLGDGPFCPGPSSAGRFDADLFRIRAVRLRLGAQAGSAAFRGLSAQWFLRPGTAPGGAWLVPDQHVQVEVCPRNLALNR